MLSTEAKMDSDAGSPTVGVGGTGLRNAVKAQKMNDECNSLAVLHRRCTRLSRSKVDAIVKYVTSLKQQNDDLVNKIAECE